MSTVLDSAIFAPLFEDPEIARLLTDHAYVRAMVQVEAALARAEGRLGIIPAGAAEEICKKALVDAIDVAALGKGTARSGFPVIALIDELRKAVGREAALYVHWGATTQDIMDTACVLQMRAAITVLKKRLVQLSQGLEELCGNYRVTVLAGRTHGQQALPVSFGLKAAAWLAPIMRHRERIDEISSRLLVVQFGGGAGTLAALGNKGLAVMDALAEELELATPLMPWHAQRDNLAEFAGWLSMVTGSLGKVAQDIILLAQTEVGEVAESSEQGRGGSSTMPQKTNPITSELVLAAARANASLLSAVHHAQIQEQERATHGWQLEWLALPQMIVLAGGALKHALYLVRNLQVDESRMRENIARANDLILAEAAVFALARHMPRSKADELVKQACRAAVSERTSLIDMVRSQTANLLPDGVIDWQSLAEPANYLGETEKIIDRVIQRARKLS